MCFDAIRRAIRQRIGYNSKIYRTGAKFLNFISVVWKEGMSTWQTLNKLQSQNSEPASPVSVGLRKLKYPIRLRPNTADAGTVINNVIREEYGKFSPAKEPEWLIDAGGYIGDTASYFLSRFPELKAIVLEPNQPSYEIALHNLEPYGTRATLLNKALWTSNGTLQFGGSSTGASVQDKGIEVDGISIPTLLDKFSISRLNILKMDIEGAERLIFSKPDEWLHRVDLIIIEIHGPEILSVISHVLQEYQFSMKQYRSIWYCERTF